MRSPRTSLSSLLSTCSTMGIGGVASGTQLISGIAGGWPLPMGHRPAIRYGGLHGSSAVGHGDVATMVLLGWSWFDSGYKFQRRRTVEVPLFVHRQSGGYCSFYEDRDAQCKPVHAAVTCTHSANCADDRRDFPGVALGPVVNTPVVVQRHMHCPSGVMVVNISVVAQMQSPMVLTVQDNIEILQLQSIEKVVDVTVGQIQQIPRMPTV